MSLSPVLNSLPIPCASSLFSLPHLPVLFLNEQLHCFSPTTRHSSTEVTRWKDFPMLRWGDYELMTKTSPSFSLPKHELSWSAAPVPQTLIPFYIKGPNLKVIKVNCKKPQEAFDPTQMSSRTKHVQKGEGWLLQVCFFTPCNFFWQLNQFCRLCNYLSRKPPRPCRPPCLCSWRAILLLMEHFFHPHPKVAAVRCRLDTVGPPGTCCPPRCGLAGLSAAMEPLGRLPGCLHPPLPARQQGGKLQRGLGAQRGGSRGGWLLCRLSQSSLALLAQLHPSWKTRGNKSCDS